MASEETNTAAAPQSAFPVVGIGASAGGLDAFKRFFQAMPTDNGMAFILVPHLDPTHESLMSELLSKHTSMAVREIEDDTPIEPNCVYVIPPNKYLSIGNGRLQLVAPPERQVLGTAIDYFFRSLAADLAERAIGIIMSGTGSHGTQGLKEIKLAGGMLMVQQPESAAYDQMPRNAIATGQIDYVLPPEEMPQALLNYVRQPYLNNAKVATLPSETRLQQLSTILAALRTRTQYDFRSYRKNMLMRRVQRRMGLCHIPELADYAQHLRENPDEVIALYKDLLIGVTHFFREHEAFQVLAQRVIPELVDHADADAPVRVWVPGCATGEEAYSIAMLLMERFEEAGKQPYMQIFATDLDTDALESARHGIYPESIDADVSAERLRRFFIRPDKHSYQVNKKLRESVLFATQNLISDAPFSKLHLISCRNLLIYLEPEVQTKVIRLFHFSLNDAGYLLLGPSESIGRRVDLFEPIAKKWRVYRRVGPILREPVDIPIVSPERRHMQITRTEPTPALPLGYKELMQKLVLADFAPASALVNRNYEILCVMGPLVNYLEFPSGELTKDLLAMARQGLRTKIRALVHKAIRSNQQVSDAETTVKRNGMHLPCSITVKPLTEPNEAKNLLLITFMDRPMATDKTTASEQAAEESSVVTQLEYELKTTREDLQSTIEEMESSNEELKASNEEVMSMNEELQSANEELETSKEELQSLNEELSTVNNQLQDKLDALDKAHNDMSNLLASTDIATIFLDTRKRIKRFTPVTAKLLNLIVTDVGRPISDFSRRVADAALLSDIDEVLQRLVPSEKEVHSEECEHYLRRISPYRTQDDRIEGVVVTFIDITKRKQAEHELKKLNETLEQQVADRTAELQRSEQKFRTLADNVPAFFSYVGPDLRYRYVNSRYVELFDRPMERIVGCTVEEIIGTLAYRIAHPHMEAALGGNPVYYEADFELPGGTRSMQVTLMPDQDSQGSVTGFFALASDITEQKRAQASLRANETRLRAVVDNTGDAIITVDAEGIIKDFNRAAQSIFGYSADEIIGQSVERLFQPHDGESYMNYLRQYTQLSGTLGKLHEIDGQRKDGELFPMELLISEVDNMRLFVNLARDISERKTLERRIIEMSRLEQERIGRDIHDGIGQQVTGLMMLATSLLRKLERPQRSQGYIEAKQLVKHLKQTLQEVKALSVGLAPVEIPPGGLIPALSRLAKHLEKTSGVACHFTAPESVSLPNSQIATHVYRIAQEALHNAVKHAQTKALELSLESNNHGLVLSVRDDGVGISVTENLPDRSPLGLSIMRHRASIVGARLDIEPVKGGGTLVQCTIPLEN